MLKSKFIQVFGKEQFEHEVNTFLDNLPLESLIEVKFNTLSLENGSPEHLVNSALIIYEEIPAV